MVHVTAFFAGLLAFLYLGLAIYVIRRRYSLQLLIGDAGDAHIIRRIRAHANFAEYVPFALLLMALDELNGTHRGVLVFVGIALVLARISHAYSMVIVEIKDPKNFKFRSFGVATTFLLMALLALIAVF